MKGFTGIKEINHNNKNNFSILRNADASDPHSKIEVVQCATANSTGVIDPKSVVE